MTKTSGGELRLPPQPWMSAPATKAVVAALTAGGSEVRFVGGCVRDAILGRPVTDIDIATPDPPPRVIELLEAAGLKAVPTGIDHGTITLVVDGTPFEVTTLREDVETFGRKANVAFGRDWRVDAERRDFTMNALSISPDGMVYDYVGGLADLRDRLVRFIGDPARRIAEDYLRILRFFRFQASYAGGAPDAAGLHACIVARDRLRTLSRERVRGELVKLLVAPYAVPTLTVMAETGFVELLLGGVPQLASFAAMVEVEAAAALAPDPVRRLGALGLFTVEDADRLRDRLRLFNAEHERLVAMVERLWRISPAHGEAEARALLYRLGPVRFADRVLLAWSRSRAGAADASWQALATLSARWTPPRFPLRAADLMSCGLARGPALGAALRAAEEAWIAAGFPSDRETLADIASRAAGRS
jgi:poly(A) polymerase